MPESAELHSSAAAALPVSKTWLTETKDRILLVGTDLQISDPQINRADYTIIRVYGPGNSVN